MRPRGAVMAAGGGIDVYYDLSGRRRRSWSRVEGLQFIIHQDSYIDLPIDLEEKHICAKLFTTNCRDRYSHDDVELLKNLRLVSKSWKRLVESSNEWWNLGLSIPPHRFNRIEQKLCTASEHKYLFTPQWY